MARSKLKLEFVENKKERGTKFKKRVSGLNRMAFNLSTLCGIQAMIVCFGTDGDVHTYPETDGKVREIIKRYRELTDERKIRNKCNLSGYLSKEIEKLKNDLLSNLNLNLDLIDEQIQVTKNQIYAKLQNSDQFQNFWSSFPSGDPNYSSEAIQEHIAIPIAAVPYNQQFIPQLEQVSSLGFYHAHASEIMPVDSYNCQESHTFQQSFNGSGTGYADANSLPATHFGPANMISSTTPYQTSDEDLQQDSFLREDASLAIANPLVDFNYQMQTEGLFHGWDGFVEHLNLIPSDHQVNDFGNKR